MVRGDESYGHIFAGSGHEVLVHHSGFCGNLDCGIMRRQLKKLNTQIMNNYFVVKLKIR